MSYGDLGSFAQLAGGRLTGADGKAAISEVVFDSREVQPGVLYVAVRGERTDGHLYISEALDRGAVAALCEEDGPGARIVVPSVVAALARYGQTLRERFDGPVVAITGSNGKTTTKEFVAAALSTNGAILKSPGNRNTELTSPLVWADSKGCWAAVVEVGMRGFGQIKHLAGIARPTIGVITNIGTAHIEKVGSRDGVFRAKAELLEAMPGGATAVLWREDDFFGSLCEHASGRVVSFGAVPDADVELVGYRALGWDRSQIRIRVDGQVFNGHMPALGRHNALNAAAAVAASWTAGVAPLRALEAIEAAEMPAMRLEVLERNGVVVLFDAYNASPDSTVAAIQALAEIPVSGRKVAILGEMRELGEFEESGHRLVGAAIAHNPLDAVHLVGPSTRFIMDEARMIGSGQTEIDQCDVIDIVSLQQTILDLSEGDIALIKGSRALGLERAVSGWRL